MAGALRNCGSLRTNNATISFLVVATSDLCDKVFDALHVAAKERKCRIVVHQCEFIAEVTRPNFNLAVDFIVFAIDGQVTQSIVELEKNISFVDDDYFISGKSCLVYCQGKFNNLGVILYKAQQLADKYSIRSFLTTNINDLDNSLELAKKILNICDGVLSLEQGLPIFNI